MFVKRAELVRLLSNRPRQGAEPRSWTRCRPFWVPINYLDPANLAADNCIQIFWTQAWFLPLAERSSGRVLRGKGRGRVTRLGHFLSRSLLKLERFSS